MEEQQEERLEKEPLNNIEDDVDETKKGSIASSSINEP